MEHEDGVEIAGDLRIRLDTGELPQEISGVGEGVVGANGRFAFPYSLPTGHYGRHARDEPDGLCHVGLARLISKVGIGSGQDRDCRLEDVHGKGLFRQMP